MSAPCKPSIGRLTNYRTIIDALRSGEMTRDEISHILGYSQSGARKYIAALVAASVLIEVGKLKSVKGQCGQGVYSLAGEDAIEAFFIARNIEARKPVAEPKQAMGESAYVVAQRDSSRHFHFLKDDCQHPFKVESKQTVVDPLALPDGFFKPSPDFVERRQAERAPVPAPTGFAALDVHFSRRLP